MALTILGTGHSVPAYIRTNDELAQVVDTSDEWISTRTGIKKRHICTQESLTDIAVEAAENALKNASVSANELDYIICPTLRGDYITPSLACMVQKRIGAKCPSFDINAACSGFLYALNVAAGLFSMGDAKKVLIIAAEAMSKMIDWNDRATCVLFGDGAGAAVVGAGEDLLSIELSAKGNEEVLRIPNVSGASPFSPLSEAPCFLYMNGQEVYKFAVSSICRGIRKVIEKAKVTAEDITYVILHQANMRIIEAAQKRMKIPMEKFRTNIDAYGNLSAVSIPLLLDELNRNGTLRKGDLLALSAFGGGLTTGACVLRWNK